MFGDTKAGKMWSAYYEFLGYESELHDLCEEHSIPYQDWTHDAYDGSLELYGFPEKYLLSEDQQKVLWNFGFCAVWTHTASMQEGPKYRNPNDEEHYYRKIK